MRLTATILIVASLLLGIGTPGFAQHISYTNGGYPACYSQEQLNYVVGFADNTVRKRALVRRLENDRCIILLPNTPVMVQEVDWSKVRILLLETGESMWTVRGAIYSPF